MKGRRLVQWQPPAAPPDTEGAALGDEVGTGAAAADTANVTVPLLVSTPSDTSSANVRVPPAVGAGNASTGLPASNMALADRLHPLPPPQASDWETRR